MSSFLIEPVNYAEAAAFIVQNRRLLSRPNWLNAEEREVLLKVSTSPKECVVRHKADGNSPLAVSLNKLNRKLDLTVGKKEDACEALIKYLAEIAEILKAEEAKLGKKRRSVKKLSKAECEASPKKTWVKRHHSKSAKGKRHSVIGFCRRK